MTTYFDILPTELVDIIYQKTHKVRLNECLKQIQNITYPFSIKKTDLSEFHLIYGDTYYRRGDVWDSTTLIGMINVFGSSYNQTKLKYKYFDIKSNQRINIYKKELLKKLFEQNGKRFVKTKPINELIKEWLKF